MEIRSGPFVWAASIADDDDVIEKTSHTILAALHTRTKPKAYHWSMLLTKFRLGITCGHFLKPPLFYQQLDVGKPRRGHVAFSYTAAGGRPSNQDS